MGKHSAGHRGAPTTGGACSKSLTGRRPLQIPLKSPTAPPLTPQVPPISQTTPKSPAFSREWETPHASIIRPDE
ncbi:hypothetical protein CO2235_MP10417 [Cupriavidus oxalaticus]|uniref:Uncharacterized protein n=1 Tax=Cupriavidus oxalaticus TaxID=96344 RepID=A0A375GFV9_9BURK|nr:hypothetical protein CO2235_MP10417 [Cupriavidus oxalaticus]